MNRPIKLLLLLLFLFLFVVVFKFLWNSYSLEPWYKLVCTTPLGLYRIYTNLLGPSAHDGISPINLHLVM